MAMSDTYRKLRRTIPAAITPQGVLPLQSSLVPGFAAFFDLLGLSRIAIGTAEVEANNAREIRVHGNLSAYGSRFAVVLEIRDGTPIEAQLELSKNAAISLADLRESPTSPVGALVDTFAAVSGAELDLQVNGVSIVASSTGALTITGRSTSQLELELGGRTIKPRAHLRMHSAAAAAPGAGRTVELSFSAGIKVADEVIALDVDLDPGSRPVVRGSWTSENGSQIPLSQLFATLRIGKPDIPDRFDVGLTSLRFEYDSVTTQLGVHAGSKLFGEVEVHARKRQSGPWDHVVIFAAAPGTRPSSLPVLGRSLKPVDVFEFEELRVAYASAELGLPSAEGSPRQVVSKGANIIGTVNLDGGDDGSGSTAQLGSVLDTPRLYVSASVGEGPVQLVSHIDGTLDLGGGLSLTSPFVSLQAKPFGLAIGGIIEMDLGETVLTAQAAVAIDATQIAGRFAIAATDADGQPANLLAPLGIRGVSLSALGMLVGINFAPPSATIGLAAVFGLGSQPPASNELGIVLHVVPTAPIPVVNILVVHFSIDEMDLPTIIDVFTDDLPALPTELSSLRLTGIEFRYGQRPTTMPDGTLVMPGIRLAGAIDMFGFSARAALAIDAISGVRGRFEMDPLDIRLGDVPIVRIGRVPDPTAASTSSPVALPATTRSSTLAEGPVFEFNSRGPRYLYANAEMELFGFLRNAVVVEVDADGLRFKTEMDIGGAVKTTLECSVSTGTRPGFSGTASFALDLDLDVPFMLGELDLGFHLDSELRASMAITANTDEFELVIDGSFDFEGIGFELPTLRLHIPLKAFTDVAAMIVAHIIDEAEDLFSALFDEIAQLWEDAGAAIAEFAAEAEEAIQEIGEAAAKTIEEIEQGAAQAVAAVGAAVQDAAQAVDELTSEAAKVVEAGIAEVAEVGEDLVEFVEETEAAIDVAVEQAEAAIVSAAEDVAEFAGRVAEDIAELAAEAEQEVARVLAEAAATAREIEAAASKFASDVAKEAENLARSIEADAKRMAAEAEALWKEIEAFLEAAANELAKGAEAVGKGIADGAQVVAAGVSSGAKAVGKTFEDAGKTLFGWL